MNRPLALFLVGCSLAGAVVPSARGSEVRGVVADVAGEPVPWIPVRYRGTSSGASTGGSVPTRADGSFYLRQLRPGTYELTPRYYGGGATPSVGVSVTVPADGAPVVSDLTFVPPADATASLSLRATDPDGGIGSGSFGVSLPELGGAPLVLDWSSEGTARVRYLRAGTFKVGAYPANNGGPSRGIPFMANDLQSVETSATVEAGTDVAVTVPLGPPYFTAPSGITAVDADAAVDWLNDERVRNGLPGGIVENRRWSAACEAHNTYTLLNPNASHDEFAGDPGYSDAGYWAGTHSVVAFSGGAFNHWFNAPKHLQQLYAPSLKVVGASFGAGGCVNTLAGRTRGAPSQPTVWVYPGDGAVGVPAAQFAAEQPSTPNQDLGLPDVTGRQLMVWLSVPADYREQNIDVLAASLRGPEGEVPLRWIDFSSSPTHPGGAIIVPVPKLREHSTYTASVTVRSREATVPDVSRTWSFTTGADPLSQQTPATKPGPPKSPVSGGTAQKPVKRKRPRLTLSRSVIKRGSAVTVRISAGSPGKATLRFTPRMKTGSKRSVKIGRNGALKLKLSGLRRSTRIRLVQSGRVVASARVIVRAG